MNPNVEKTEESHPAKPSARRRLIRGAFAAPVALTLYSGSSFAALSVTCLGRQITLPVLAAPINDPVPASDTYVRVRLQKFTRTGSGAGTEIGTNTNRWSRWVQGSDVTAFQAAGRTNYLPTGNWQLFDRGLTAGTDVGSVYRGNTLGSILTSSTPSELTAGGNCAQTQAGDQWVALRVDASGNIIGTSGLSGTTGTSISKSCWTSVRLNAR